MSLRLSDTQCNRCIESFVPAHDWVRGWTSIFTAVLFIGGAQLVTLGIIGEYIGRIYAEVKRRPLYVVEEKLGFGDGGEVIDRSLAP